MQKKPPKFFLHLSLAFTVITSIIFIQVYYSIPSKISFMQKEDGTCPFSSFVQSEFHSKTKDVITTQDRPISSLKSGGVQFDTQNVGVYDVDLSLFGILPIKEVSVEVKESTKVVVGGNLLGLKMNTDGVVVVGLSHVLNAQSQKLTPMANAGIHVGDQIEMVNGEKMDTVKQLVNVVEKSRGGEISVRYKHDGSLKETVITPALSQDGSYKLGAWVRDSSAGIGTMTFYNPQNNTFGALGHAICDVDTNEPIRISGGSVLSCEIMSVTKSQRGTPGQIKGFLTLPCQYGNIEANEATGVYGKIVTGDFEGGTQMEVGSSFAVKEGPAEIWCSLDGKTIEHYQIIIEKKSVNTAASRGMILKITDPTLLDKTGGIVQGMSGSPVVQNGKLVGAVTHVFVNDPTRGYGIFIENMLDECAHVCH